MTEPAQVSHSVQALVGARIWFAEEKGPYRVRAGDDRFLICTKPFNPQRTVLYCIVDIQKQVRGPENLVFGFGAETDEQCAEMLCRLRDAKAPSEISRRRSLPFRIVKIESPNTERSQRAAPGGTLGSRTC